MMKKVIYRLFVAVMLCLFVYPEADAQIVAVGDMRINTDSVRREFDKGPYFSLYKDNYFIFGPAIGPKMTRENTNAKFQVSIAQKLTKSTLPWNTYLYLFYTQKVFWNVLEESLPMTDLNFNPGIGICKPLFVKTASSGNSLSRLSTKATDATAYSHDRGTVSLSAQTSSSTPTSASTVKSGSQSSTEKTTMTYSVTAAYIRSAHPTSPTTSDGTHRSYL